MLRVFIWLQTLIIALAAPKADHGVTFAPPIPSTLRNDAAPFLKSGSQRFFGWHPIERKILLSASGANATQLFVVDRPMGIARQLTFGPEPVTEGAYQPETGRHILLQSKVVGVDGPQMFRIYPESKKPVPVLLSDGRRPYNFPRWAPNGQQVAFLARSPGEAGLGLGILNPLAPQTARRLTALRGANWAIENWAPNSKILLLLQKISEKESYMHLADAGTGTLSAITPSGSGRVARALARFVPGLGAVLYTSDVDSDFQQLCRLNLRTGVQEILLPALKWEVEALSISPNGKQAALVINEAGFGQLRLLDLKTTELSAPANLPRGLVSDLHWHTNGKELGFAVSAADSADDVFSLNTNSGQLTRWTRRVSTAHGSSSIGVVRSFDGEVVPLVYWLPDSQRFDEPVRRPVLLMLPSAPGSQRRPGHLGSHSYLLEKLGMAIVCPNLRGAGGYGNRRRQLDNGQLRLHTLADLNAVLNWIRQQPQLDGERVALWGEGYGGSISILAMAKFNSFIRCSVLVDPVTNWVEYISGAPAGEKERLREEYGDERDEKLRAFLDRFSPLDAAGNNLESIPVTSPVLLLGRACRLGKVMHDKKKSVYLLKTKNLPQNYEEKYRFLTAAGFLRKHLSTLPSR